MDKIVKPKPVSDLNSRILKKQLSHQRKDKKYQMNEDECYEMEHHKISKLLNDLTVSKFLTIKWIGVGYLSNSHILSTRMYGLNLQC